MAITEEALEFLIQHCAKVPSAVNSYALARTHQAHIHIPTLAAQFWPPRVENFPTREMTDEEKFIPLYDAACR